MWLKVERVLNGEAGRDLVRINFDDRQGNSRRRDIVELRVDGRRAIVALLGRDDRGGINIDFDVRKELEVEVGRFYEFDIRRLSWWGKLRWYMGATDPAVRIPAKIAVVSFVLGGIGLIVGFIGLYLGLLSLWTKVTS